jgi:hypothetical protein
VDTKIYREKWRLTVDGKQQPYEKSVDLQAIVVQKQDNTALRQQIDSTLDRTTYDIIAINQSVYIDLLCFIE